MIYSDPLWKPFNEERPETQTCSDTNVFFNLVSGPETETHTHTWVCLEVTSAQRGSKHIDMLCCILTPVAWETVLLVYISCWHRPPQGTCWIRVNLIPPQQTCGVRVPNAILVPRPEPWYQERRNGSWASQRQTLTYTFTLTFTKKLALTISRLTHSPYATKIARIKRYTMLSTIFKCQDVPHTISVCVKCQDVQHTISVYVKCQDVQHTISVYIKCQDVQHTISVH